MQDTEGDSHRDALTDPTWLDRIRGVPRALRRNWRLTALIGVVLLLVLAIGGFAAWRYAIWRIDTRDLRAEAFAAYEAGDFEQSSSLFAEYIARKPEDTNALHRLALARLEASDVTKEDLLEASAPLQRILEIDPKHQSARRSLTQLYIRLGFIEEAEQLAAALFNEHPRDVYAFSTLVQINLHQGDFDAVLDLTDNVLSGEIVPDQLRDTAMLAKARAYVRVGELDEAMYWAEECAKVSAANLQAQELYLQLAQRLGRPHEEFARHARRLYEQHPDVVMNQLMYAIASRAAGQRAASHGDEEAAAAYQKRSLDLLRGTASKDLTPTAPRAVRRPDGAVGRGGAVAVGRGDSSGGAGRLPGGGACRGAGQPPGAG